jgi:hypothetical protein
MDDARLPLDSQKSLLIYIKGCISRCFMVVKPYKIVSLVVCHSQRGSSTTQKKDKKKKENL